MRNYELTDIERRLPHLWHVLQFNSATQTAGLCFHRSVALCLDMPTAKLMLGTVRAANEQEQREIPNASLVPFIHCWIECGDTVYAPTTIERAGRLYAVPRDFYYNKNGIYDTLPMTRAAIVKLAKAHKWSSHMLRNNPPRLKPTLGEVLLAASGLPHTVTDKGGVIPQA